MCASVAVLSLSWLLDVEIEPPLGGVSATDPALDELSPLEDRPSEVSLTGMADLSPGWEMMVGPSVSPNEPAAAPGMPPAGAFDRGDTMTVAGSSSAAGTAACDDAIGIDAGAAGGASWTICVS
jgi:hypothetical protein